MQKEINLSLIHILRYMYKTVRKYYGEAIVVTQEVDDIISSPVVKESIINKMCIRDRAHTTRHVFTVVCGLTMCLVRVVRSIHRAG